MNQRRNSRLCLAMKVQAKRSKPYASFFDVISLATAYVHCALQRALVEAFGTTSAQSLDHTLRA